MTLTKSLFYYLTYKSRNHCQLGDTHCVEIVAMLLLACVQMKAPIVVISDYSDQVSDSYLDLVDQNC
jgi:hypothetical protein